MAVRQENFSQSHRGSFVLLSLAALVVVCAGIKLAAPILAPVVLGAYIATVNVPLVSWLYGRRVPLILTVATALLADAVMLGGFSWLLIGAVARLSGQLPLYLSRLELVEAQASEALFRLGLSIRLYEVLDPASVVGMLASLATDLATGI